MLKAKIDACTCIGSLHISNISSANDEKNHQLFKPFVLKLKAPNHLDLLWCIDMGGISWQKCQKQRKAQVPVLAP